MIGIVHKRGGSKTPCHVLTAKASIDMGSAPVGEDDSY